MRQAYDYWQDQPGNYPSGNNRTLLETATANPSVGVLSQGRWHSTDRHSAPGIRSAGRRRRLAFDPSSDGNPSSLCHVFPQLHPSKLRTYRSNWRVRGMSRKYVGEEALFGSSSLYSWPKVIRYNNHPFSRCLARDNLATSSVISVHATRRASLVNFALFSQNATISYPGTVLEQGLLILDRIQLVCSFGLSRSLPSH